MHKTKQHKRKRNHHNTQYTWFTPSVGATPTELCFIQLFTNNSYGLRTQLQVFSIIPKLHTELQILSYKTLCALSCRGHPCTQLGLNLNKTLCALTCRGCPCTQLGLNLKPKICLSFFASNYHHTRTFEKISFLLYISAYLYKCTITIPCV